MNNWAANVTFQYAALERPASVEEVQAIVRRAASDGTRCRVVGSRHSFNTVADVGADGTWISLERMRALVSIDDEGRALVQGGATYGEICPQLHARGWALHNMASLPHVTIAGAVATATHGSGRANGNLATSVVEVHIVAASGETVVLGRGHRDWDGAVASLGCLGVVVALVLQCEPAYALAQRVWDRFPLSVVAASQRALADTMGLAHSVSIFTRWEGGTNADSMLWVKQRVAADCGGDSAPRLPAAVARAGCVAATVKRHPIIALDAAPCTEQFGAPGPWHERLPHFNHDDAPSVGDELQSEFFVAFSDGAAAIRAVSALRATLAPVLAVTELRSVAADTQWLSPARGRASLALHFTWRGGMFHRVWAACRAVERALAPFQYRPHLGKVFTATSANVGREAAARFAALQRSLGGDVFRNAFSEAYLFQSSSGGDHARRALHGAPKDAPSKL